MRIITVKGVTPPTKKNKKRRKEEKKQKKKQIELANKKSTDKNKSVYGLE
jgi:hypothetical protein